MALQAFLGEGIVGAIAGSCWPLLAPGVPAWFQIPVNNVLAVDVIQSHQGFCEPSWEGLDWCLHWLPPVLDQESGKIALPVADLGCQMLLGAPPRVKVVHCEPHHFQ